MSFLHFVEATTLELVLMAVGIALCVAGYALRLAVHVQTYNRKPATVPMGVVIVVVFFGYFGWAFWCGADPVKMNIPSAISIPIGSVLTVLGIGLFLYSEITKHGVADSDELVTTGIYSKFRHPMYIGLLLMHLGFPLVFNSFAALVSTLVWLGFILSWRRLEEKELERRFGDRYIEYKSRTWF